MEALLRALEASVQAWPAMHRMGRVGTPDPHALERALERFRWLCFPGFFGPSDGAHAEASSFLRMAVTELHDTLVPQLALAERSRGTDSAAAAAAASAWMLRLLEALPAIRATLHQDAQEAWAADPAARTFEEVILCYPGIQAMVTHRFAHALHTLGVPLAPRMLAEISHRRTGIDIHPGASIGAGLFIDHGTGVVIGETTVIGTQCRIYPVSYTHLTLPTILLV